MAGMGSISGMLVFSFWVRNQRTVAGDKCSALCLAAVCVSSSLCKSCKGSHRGFFKPEGNSAKGTIKVQCLLHAELRLNWSNPDTQSDVLNVPILFVRTAHTQAAFFYQHRVKWEHLCVPVPKRVHTQCVCKRSAVHRSDDTHALYAITLSV
eukprot:4901166-Amphidinium_carterae.1